MEKLLPNMQILKSPSNWFFVLFSMALLLIISHVFLNKRIDE